MKKFNRKILFFVAIIILSLSAPNYSFPTTEAPNVVEAATVKLNKKKLTLRKGKTFRLKVKGTKGKVTWKSSKKSVATVDQKGKVRAKKSGRATITAKVGSTTLKCKVTVKNATRSSYRVPTPTPTPAPETYSDFEIMAGYVYHLLSNNLLDIPSSLQISRIAFNNYSRTVYVDYSALTPNGNRVYRSMSITDYDYNKTDYIWGEKHYGMYLKTSNYPKVMRIDRFTFQNSGITELDINKIIRCDQREYYIYNYEYPQYRDTHWSDSVDSPGDDNELRYF